MFNKKLGGRVSPRRRYLALTPSGPKAPPPPPQIGSPQMTCNETYSPLTPPRFCPTPEGEKTIIMEGKPTQKRHIHPNKSTTRTNNFGSVCTNCHPLSFKTSREQPERVRANCLCKLLLFGWVVVRVECLFWIKHVRNVHNRRVVSRAASCGG